MSYEKFLDDLNTLYANGRRFRSLDKSLEAVRDIWLKEKRYKELIAFIIQNWGSGNCDAFMRPLTRALIGENELVLYKQLWKGVIRNRLTTLWNHHSNLMSARPTISVEEIRKVGLFWFRRRYSRRATPLRWVARIVSRSDHLRLVAYYRRSVLQGISEFVKGLQRLGDVQEVERQHALYAAVFALERPKPKPTTDKRKIDEALFWQLIGESRAASENSPHFLEILRETLERFHPRELRAFDRILHMQLNEINTWEVWALAYIVRRGCGDDAFDYFRAWVVSLGRENFLAIKTIDETKLPGLFDEDPQLEELYYVAQEVYERKTQDIMKPVRVKYRKISGKRWEEDDLPQAYPSLCKMFGYGGTRTNPPG